MAAVSYNINPEHVNSHPYYAAFVQDEWRATRNLTLTLGIRYNLELGSIEQNNHYVFLDTTSPSPLKAPFRRFEAAKLLIDAAVKRTITHAR